MELFWLCRDHPSPAADRRHLQLWSVTGLADWGTSPWLPPATLLKFFSEVSPMCKVRIWEGDCPEEEGEKIIPEPALARLPARRWPSSCGAFSQLAQALGLEAGVCQAGWLPSGISCQHPPLPPPFPHPRGLWELWLCSSSAGHCSLQEKLGLRMALSKIL